MGEKPKYPKGKPVLLQTRGPTMKHPMKAKTAPWTDQGHFKNRRDAIRFFWSHVPALHQVRTIDQRTDTLTEGP
jgi:hypothetical protein